MDPPPSPSPSHLTECRKINLQSVIKIQRDIIGHPSFDVERGLCIICPIAFYVIPDDSAYRGILIRYLRSRLVFSSPRISALIHVARSVYAWWEEARKRGCTCWSQWIMATADASFAASSAASVTRGGHQNKSCHCPVHTPLSKISFKFNQIISCCYRIENRDKEKIIIKRCVLN